MFQHSSLSDSTFMYLAGAKVQVIKLDWLIAVKHFEKNKQL